MIASISGDIIGSIFERHAQKTTEFDLFFTNSHFTDDTVLTVAIADCLLNGKDYADTVRSYARAYPNAGYGGTFRQWMMGLINGPYNSWGNGSAMRVSPIGFAFDTLDKVLEEAEKSAAITHNHSEGIKGAQATAAAVFLAKDGASKLDIKDYIESTFGYDLNRTLENIRPDYSFDVSCQGSVPESIIAFLESESIEDAIRKAISLGGDADTMACIAGGIAQAFYKAIPASILEETKKRLPGTFLQIIEAFNKTFSVNFTII